MKKPLRYLNFVSLLFISCIYCAPMMNICVDVVEVSGGFQIICQIIGYDQQSLDKGPSLDGRYVLKKRSDEKPADACVNGCIYYKGKELFDHQNNNDIIFPIQMTGPTRSTVFQLLMLIILKIFLRNILIFLGEIIFVRWLETDC